MFRASICPSSGAHDDGVGYHIGRLILELLLVGRKCRQDGWVSGPKAVTLENQTAYVVANVIVVSF